MMIEIKNRYTGVVIYTHSGDTLSDAYLRGADLCGADLRRADLSDAYLRGANLFDTNLRDANLRRADLRGANLGDAYLFGADLFGANLRGADLSGANLGDANLGGAYLGGANLRGADLFGQKIEKTPIQINNLTWPIIITEHHMRIGCQVHTHQVWEDFTGDEIVAMSPDAFEFAEKWRSILLMMCHEHAKESK